MIDPIERAKKIAKNLIRVKQLDNPINIYDIIDGYATYEFEHLIPFDFDGLCFFNNSKPHIVINGNIPTSRQKFTLAHELGHILIPGHKNIMACYMENNSSITKSEKENTYLEYRQKESEANTFASELLMPSEWIKSIVIELNSYEDILNEVYLKTELSIQAMSIQILKYMQPGIVIIITHQNMNDPLIFSSDYFNMDDIEYGEYLQRLIRVSKKQDTFYFYNYFVRVFDLYEDIELKDDFKVPEKKSTDILMDYLKNEFLKEKANTLFRSINGIVSNINSRQKISTMTKDEYYYIVKSKFRCRDEVIRRVADSKEFQRYIVKRYYELCEKDKINK